MWLGLIVAVTSASVLLVAAGAQRTSSAPDRYTSARGGDLDATVIQEQGRSRASEVAALAGAASVESMTFVFGGLIGPGGSDPLDVLTFGGSVAASSSRLVAGREPDAGVDGEFAATQSFVDAIDVEIGDTLQLVTFTQEQADRLGFDAPDPAGPTVEAVLVGIVDGPGEIDFPTASAIFSASLLDHPELGIAATIMSIDLRTGVDLATFRAQLDTLPDSGGFALEPSVLVSETIRTAVDAQATGLWLLAAVAAMAVVAVLGQLISRNVRLSLVEQSRLSALGFSDGQLMAEAAGREAVPIVGGVVVGVGLAAVASGIFPTGFVRRLEPRPGLRVEAVVLAAGGLAVLVALMLWTLTALLVTRSSVRARLPSPAVEAIACRSGSAPGAVGVRFAFTRRPQERGSVRASVVGVALIVAGVVAAITFALSLDRLVTEPVRWGNSMDLAFGSGAQEFPADARAALEADADVAALTIFASGQARVGDETLGLVGMEPVRGDITAPVLIGRLPVSDDEIGLGRLTADALGAEVGDEVAVEGEGGATRLHVTGIVVVPGIAGVDGVGQGAVVSMRSLMRLDPSTDGGTAAVDVRAGAPPGTAGRLSALTSMETGPPTEPPAIVTVGRVRSIPFVLAALLSALAVLSVGHVMLTSVSGRRRDLAVLRALGADQRWIARAVHWQATAFTVLALMIGAPLGVIVGRLVFAAFANSLGTINDPVVPVAVVAAGGAASLVLANVLATLPARRSRRVAPAALLQAE